MLDKNAAVQDPEANAKKADTDRRAAELIGFDREQVRKNARDIAEVIRLRPGLERIVIGGAAGSGKTSIAKALALELEIKHIDLDDFIPGGYTDDKYEYSRRFNRGLYEAWDSVPHKAGWIIEHVEAMNRDLVNLYSPNYALFVDPGMERVRRAAEARAAVSDDSSKDRLARALETEKTSRKQYDSFMGTVLPAPKGFKLQVI